MPFVPEKDVFSFPSFAIPWRERKKNVLFDGTSYAGIVYLTLPEHCYDLSPQVNRRPHF